MSNLSPNAITREQNSLPNTQKIIFQQAQRALCISQKLIRQAFAYSATALTLPAAHFTLHSAGLAESIAMRLSRSKRPTANSNLIGAAGLIAGATASGYGYVALAKLAFNTLVR
jgi:hypothetical protein